MKNLENNLRDKEIKNSFHLVERPPPPFLNGLKAHNLDQRIKLSKHRNLNHMFLIFI